MIRLSEREKQLLFILVVLVMFATTFKFGYMDVVAKSDALAAENVSLYSRIKELNAFIDQEAENKVKIEEMKQGSKAIATKYGSKNTPEKTLVFFDTIEKLTAMDVKDITFGEKLPVGIGSAENVGQETGATEETLQVEAVGEIRLYCTPITIRYSTSYAGLKDAMKIINNCPERMTVDSINTAYDQGTGKLSGTFVLNMYEITGTDKVYYPPSITDIPLGNLTPFSIN